MQTQKRENVASMVNKSVLVIYLSLDLAVMVTKYSIEGATGGTSNGRQ